MALRKDDWRNCRSNAEAIVIDDEKNVAVVIGFRQQNHGRHGD